MALVRPATTHAVIFRAPGDVSLEEVPLPALEAGDLLLRVTACGLCPGEVMDWYMARKAPVPLGHEAVGEVVDAGAGAAFRPGTRVFVHHHAPCLVCRACRRGDHVHCAEWRSRQLLPGGLATYAVARAAGTSRDALPLHAGMTDAAGTFIEPLACVLKSIRRARLRPEDRVLVVGTGVMGLLHLMALRTRSEPSLLLATDGVPARRAAAAVHADIVLEATAESLPEAVRDATGGAGADVVIVSPGSTEALETARQAVAPGGTIVVFTPTPPEVTWPAPLHDLFFREVTIVASYSAAPEDTRQALTLISDGLPVESLITHRLTLAQAEVGYRLVRAGGAALKVIVAP